MGAAGSESRRRKSARSGCQGGSAPVSGGLHHRDAVVGAWPLRLATGPGPGAAIRGPALEEGGGRGWLEWGHVTVECGMWLVAEEGQWE